MVCLGLWAAMSYSESVALKRMAPTTRLTWSRVARTTSPFAVRLTRRLPSGRQWRCRASWAARTWAPHSALSASLSRLSRAETPTANTHWITSLEEGCIGVPHSPAETQEGCIRVPHSQAETQGIWIQHAGPSVMKDSNLRAETMKRMGLTQILDFF